MLCHSTTNAGEICQLTDNHDGSHIALRYTGTAWRAVTFGGAQ